MRTLEIAAADGTLLPASLFEAPSPQAVVIVNPATATPRGFYHSFCRYLAQCGATALVYDYRGTFEPPRELRGSNARMRDWGTLDFAGVVAWASARYPGVPLHAVGHSVGGHVLLMTPENAKISRAVLVASQSGFWRHYRGFEKFRVGFFVSVVMPLLTRLFGYFPGERTVFGTNLPSGVLHEWSRWCKSRGYFLDDPEMTSVLAHARTLTAGVTMIGVSDDPWATPQAIDAIVPAFTAATIARREIDPAQFGLGSVGHMGFFRSTNGPALWPLIAHALDISPAALQRTS